MDYLTSHPLLLLAAVGSVSDGTRTITREAITSKGVTIRPFAGGALLITSDKLDLISFNERGTLTQGYRLVGSSIQPYFPPSITPSSVIIRSRYPITIKAERISTPWESHPLVIITPGLERTGGVEYNGHQLSDTKSSIQYRVTYHRRSLLLIGRPAMIGIVSSPRRPLVIRFHDHTPSALEINHRVITPADPSFARLISSMDSLLREYLSS